MYVFLDQIKRCQYFLKLKLEMIILPKRNNLLSMMRLKLIINRIPGALRKKILRC